MADEETPIPFKVKSKLNITAGPVEDVTSESVVDIIAKSEEDWMRMQAWHAQQMSRRESQHVSHTSSEHIVSSAGTYTGSQSVMKEESEIKTEPYVMEPHDPLISTVRTELGSYTEGCGSSEPLKTKIVWVKTERLIDVLPKESEETYGPVMSAVKADPASDKTEQQYIKMSTVKTGPASDETEPQYTEMSTVKAEPDSDIDGNTTVPDVHQAAMKGPEGASSETLFVSIEENPVLPSSTSVIISEHDVGQRPDTPGVREEAGRITPTSSQRGIKRPRQRHSSDTRPALDITADEKAYFNVQTRLGQAVLDDVMPLVPMLYNVLQAQQRVLELKAQKFELEIRNLQK